MWLGTLIRGINGSWHRDCTFCGASAPCKDACVDTWGSFVRRPTLQSSIEVHSQHAAGFLQGTAVSQQTNLSHTSLTVKCRITDVPAKRIKSIIAYLFGFNFDLDLPRFTPCFQVCFFLFLKSSNSINPSKFLQSGQQMLQYLRL